MRIFGIILGFALVLPFLLPQPGSGLSHHEANAGIYDASLDGSSEFRPARRIELGKLVWALNALDSESLSEEGRCLAQAVYFEARSEPLEGQLAVAQVVLNRAGKPNYPDTICGVVFQNEALRHRCQFSFACDGLSDQPYEEEAWDLATRIAFVALTGRWEDITDGADHYHANYVRPSWSDHLMPTSQHGSHIFYRDGAS